jgi:succinate dehydrogenase / fumarate reductase flavoprotein subunit
LFFGRWVGENIAKDVHAGITFKDAKVDDATNAINELSTLRENNGNIKVPELRTKLQESMTNNAGVFRTGESLTNQKEILKALKEEFKNIRIDDKSEIYNTDLQEAVELGHMLDFAAFIVEGALARNESRGAHFRNDFPTRDDEKYLKHTMAYMKKDGNIDIDYMDVVMGKYEPVERTY